MKRFYDQLLSDGNEVELKDDISAEHGFVRFKYQQLKC